MPLVSKINLAKKEEHTTPVETPLMKQYNSIKAKYPDAILLFRVGDFYETFGQDAIKVSGILGIVLTRRANGSAQFIELAGFPHHALDTYLPKLVRAGNRVAICDQLEDPKLTKTIVKRGVTELVTPGVSYNDKTHDVKNNNFLACLHYNAKNTNVGGIAFIDVSTGEFYAAQGDMAYCQKLIHSFKPNEIVFSKAHKKLFVETFGDNYYSFGADDWAFQFDYANETLSKHFQTNSLKGFGMDEMPDSIIAAGVAIHYLNDTAHDKLKHISAVSRIDEDKYMWLDRFTLRNLELLYSHNYNATTLFDVIDTTTTAMGSRLLKRWLALPLKELQPIAERQQVVEFFLNHQELLQEIITQLKRAGDLERLISRVAVGRVNPRELLQLKNALQAVDALKILLQQQTPSTEAIKKIAEQLNPCHLIVEKIEKAIDENSPSMVAKGGVICAGYNEELDDLRNIQSNGKNYLLQIQQREIENTGIPSLKVAFNNVFGYYLEVTNIHKNKVPETWMRKQTLANAERYITEELKVYEEKIMGAEDKIAVLELNLYNAIVTSLLDYIAPIQLNASLMAQLDCLASFAITAQKNNYTKPTLNDTNIIDIKNGRHPVIEKQLPITETYVANDVYLDNEQQQIIMITGPNMSGKSAILRQTALIVIMAQIGSYVPATHANLGLIDKVFTRVGASDNISSGESTFMVEMNETASIMNNLSNRSLVLLDEIGRGTSTYDGISIAWAIAEYLHEHNFAKAKTLFATHYHELNEMTNNFPRIKNFNVSVQDTGNKVIFLRKLQQGGSHHSFGIHVAKMAGMPSKIITRANKILQTLEETHNNPTQQAQKELAKKKEEYQLSFFQLDDPVLSQIKDELKHIDINTLTPVEALIKLNEIKKLVGGN